MIDAAQRQLIAETARELVAHIAPQELPRFRAAADAYFQDPARPLKRQAPKDDNLGFGLGTELVFLTPVVLSVTTQVVTFLGDELAKSLAAGGAAMATAYVKKMFTRSRSAGGAEDKAAPVLTHDELMRVRSLAYAEARRLELSESRANLLADSVVGSLATSST